MFCGYCRRDQASVKQTFCENRVTRGVPAANTDRAVLEEVVENTATNKVDNFQPISFGEVSRIPLNPWNNFAIEFDRHSIWLHAELI